MAQHEAAELGGADARAAARRRALTSRLLAAAAVALALVPVILTPAALPWLLAAAATAVLAGVLARMEARRMAAEAAARDRQAFLAALGHEIRTPLNGVLGMLQALEADRLGPVQRERLRAARACGHDVAAILEAVLGRQPQRDAPPPAAEPQARRPEPDLRQARVLAAEDNPMNQLVVKTLLGQHGVEPVVVENGAEALAAWRREPFDVILLDVQMPEMDGPAAARAIRAEEAARGLPRTPIVALTANAMPHQIEECFAAGMDQHVAKPVEAGLLFDAIAQALLQPRARTDAAA